MVPSAGFGRLYFGASRGWTFGEVFSQTQEQKFQQVAGLCRVDRCRAPSVDSKPAQWDPTATQIMPCSSARALLMSCRIGPRLELRKVRQISVIRSQLDGRRCSTYWKTGTIVGLRRCSHSWHAPQHLKIISTHFPSSSTVLHLQSTVTNSTTPRRYSCYKKSQRTSV